jgi:cell envelope opacity-associated protein A
MAKFGDLPYKERGITITEELIITAIELLNSSEGKILPQNARNEVVDKTPYGLDKLIKLKLQTDTRTANIISDILEKKGIAKVTTIKNARTGRIIKATRLLDDFTWQVPSLEQMKECE